MIWHAYFAARRLWIWNLAIPWPGFLFRLKPDAADIAWAEQVFADRDAS